MLIVLLMLEVMEVVTMHLLCTLHLLLAFELCYISLDARQNTNAIFCTISINLKQLDKKHWQWRELHGQNQMKAAREQETDTLHARQE